MNFWQHMVLCSNVLNCLWIYTVYIRKLCTEQHILWMAVSVQLQCLDGRGSVGLSLRLQDRTIWQVALSCCNHMLSRAILSNWGTTNWVIILRSSLTVAEPFAVSSCRLFHISYSTVYFDFWLFFPQLNSSDVITIENWTHFTNRCNETFTNLIVMFNKNDVLL